MSGEVVIVDSGSGNLRSVERALAAVGARPRLTSDPEIVRRAERVVVPGQGAFKDCMVALRAGGLDEALREVIGRGRPYLGICLGLQVLFDESEEHGQVAGLGLVPGRVVRFAAAPGRKVPHIGWNDVLARRADPLLEGMPERAYLYFIHSYHVVPRDPDATLLECDYHGRFVAAIRVGNLFACQFHPEKSQAVGLRLLERFARAA